MGHRPACKVGGTWRGRIAHGETGVVKGWPEADGHALWPLPPTAARDLGQDIFHAMKGLPDQSELKLRVSFWTDASSPRLLQPPDRIAILLHRCRVGSHR
jgi:hypothetical protein